MSASSIGFARTLRRPIRAAATTALSFCAALLMGAAILAGPAEASAPEAAQHKVPMQSFLTAYLHGMHENNFKSAAGFRIPSIMLFSPDGKMQAQATDDATLATLKNTFQSGSVASAQADQPGVAIFTGIISKAGDIAANSLTSANPKQWTAIILSSENPACASCKKFEKAFSEMHKQDPAKLHPVQVLLTN